MREVIIQVVSISIVGIVSYLIKIINSKETSFFSFFYKSNRVKSKLDEISHTDCIIKKRLLINELEQSFPSSLKNFYGLYKFNLVDYAIAEKLSSFISHHLIKNLFLSYSIKVDIKNKKFSFHKKNNINTKVRRKRWLILIAYIVLSILTALLFYVASQSNSFVLGIVIAIIAQLLLVMIYFSIAIDGIDMFINTKNVVKMVKKQLPDNFDYSFEDYKKRLLADDN
ncbi:hypothetical protein [Francisella marina]|uniref:DUF2721 domain-containing protein n=1 Tax=Francisella marina TaxID=2249302 RepID=A0ABX5ZF56_9GAMM|nr:hypothetical protein [Francisella marina]QEO57024.1 hypothetical protein F0R74_03835 [Francisella marina]QEO58860.1 hypothetical protein F0R75_03395 [Francisella marina]